MIQIAREIEIRSGFTAEQLECHEHTAGGHYLTAPLPYSGVPMRRCVQCHAILPGDYRMPA